MMEVIIVALVKGLSAGVMIGGFILGFSLCMIALAVITVFVLSMLS